MTTRFALVVTHSPLDYQHAYSAVRFAEAALDAGHTLEGVFFYQSGALNGNALQAGLSDDLNLLRRWETLAKQHNVALYLCVTAANRRGVLSAQDAADAGMRNENMSDSFQSVGLGDLAELVNRADRTLQF